MRADRAAAALLAACLAASALPACTASRGGGDAEEATDDTPLARQLKRARRAGAVLSNTSALQFAVFQGAMGNPIGDAVAAFQKTAAAWPKDAKAPVVKKALDDAVQDFPEETDAAFEPFTAKLADPFKGLKTAPRRDLARSFAHKEVQRGPEIAAKLAVKPLGLPPLTRLLKDEDLQRYVLLLSLSNPAQDDVKKLQAGFKDLTAWLGEINERAKEDKDLERVVAACAKPG